MNSIFRAVARPKKRRKRKKAKYTKYRQYDAILGDRTIKVQGYERQALKYLTDILNFDASDIKCEEEFGDALNIRYTYGKKVRTYYPDIYIVSKRLIVEVKSSHTLGLLHNKRRGWSMTCAKAIACHKKGYRFMLLLLDRRGNRILMPKNWPYMKKAECLQQINTLNPKDQLSGLFSL